MAGIVINMVVQIVDYASCVLETRSRMFWICSSFV